MQIKPEDLIIESWPYQKGNGGQAVTACSPGIKMEHIPSKITVMCEGERSQMRNREVCDAMLQAGLDKMEKQESLKELVKRFIYLLDIVEESDSGREFRPNYISSCRAYDGQEMNQLILKMKEIVNQ